MRKFITLVLVLAFAAPALSDDVILPWWADDGVGNRVMPTDQDPFNPMRYLGPTSTPGSPTWGLTVTTYSQWTYDDPCDVYDADWPEQSWFVVHPVHPDPEPIDPCLPYFSVQQWGSNSDPCNPVWFDSFAGREGVIDFAYGSWELNNFRHAFPAQDLWIQVTYFNGTSVASDPCFAVVGYDDPFDPCALDVVDAVRTVAGLELGDGWLLDVFAATLSPKPNWEYFALQYADNVFINQIIIETGFIPEPATMVLLGLGSLLLRKSRR